MSYMKKHRGSYYALLAALVMACALALGGCTTSPATEDSVPEKSSTQDQDQDQGSGSGTDSDTEPEAEPDEGSDSVIESNPQSEPVPDSSNQNAGTAVAEGAEAPDFAFTAADGTTGRLSDYRGQVVQLNFWASWCGYCVQEMPAMQAIAQSNPDVVVLAVNRGDTAQDAEKFIAENDYDFVWALDEDGSIQNLYPARGIPYTLIIDENGIITTIFNGGGPDMYPYFEEAITLAKE